MIETQGAKIRENLGKSILPTPPTHTHISEGLLLLASFCLCNLSIGKGGSAINAARCIHLQLKVWHPEGPNVVDCNCGYTPTHTHTYTHTMLVCQGHIKDVTNGWNPLWQWFLWEVVCTTVFPYIFPLRSFHRGFHAAEANARKVCSKLGIGYLK